MNAPDPDTQHQSRHIPVDVQRQLRADARERCCVCARLIPFDEIPLDIEGDILEQHHIVYFSEGGPNTEDNLLLVCRNCHKRIHDDRRLHSPDGLRYRTDDLKEARRVWKQMARLVGSNLHFETDERHASPAARTRIPFHVAALNLNYEILVPEDVDLQAVARFVSMWIMHPLVSLANLSPYRYMFGQAQLRRMGLARKSDPRTRLDLSTTVANLDLAETDALLALVDFEWAAMINRPDDKEEPASLIARITLSWGAVPADLDLHMIPVEADGVPRGGDPRSHVFYGNPGSESRPPWARLNVDIRNGFGPEILSVTKHCHGRFVVAVDNYSGETEISQSGATVGIEIGDVTRVFHCPTQGDERCWHVALLDYSAGTISAVDAYGPRPEHGTIRGLIRE